MKRTYFFRLLIMVLVVCMVFTTSVMPAFAAEIDDATIHMDQKCKLTIYKYDFTNAAKDGIWSTQSYVSTGQYDANVNQILGSAVRKGAANSSSVLGNQEVSNGYAIKGVEYTYLKVATPYQFTESENDSVDYAHVEVLYQFDKTKAAGLLNAIGLADGAKSFAPANELDETCWFYQSDVLNKALADSLAANATTVKNALEAYVKANGGTAMPLTDEDGFSIATDLEVGLYLLVETRVPEMVTNTSNPFFVSLPMTSINGGGDSTNGNTGSVSTGGHDWLYDVTIYPKNETGIVTLTKEIRESIKDTGTNGGTDDINDGFAHVATGSAGDVMEFQILSTLPTITSEATAIAEYTFQDVLSRGLSYDNRTPVKIEFFKNKTCKPEELAATWNVGDGKFTVSKVENVDGTHTMTIAITKTGLEEINTANTAAGNNNGSLYAGYSNYTLRITYAAKLNSDESLVYGDAGNSNEVVLTWRRSSSDYFDTLIDDCHVMSYGINLTKKFSDNADDQSLFDQVLFKIQNKTDGYYVIAELNETEGIWYVTGHTERESAATSINPVAWNGKPGQIVLKGIEDDEYILTEIETANSYTLLKENISVRISVADDATHPCKIYSKDALGVIQNDTRFNFDGGLNLELANIPQAALAHNFLTASATVGGNNVTMINDEVDTTSANALATLTVVNNHGFNLPQTGEQSHMNMPIIGGCITLFAVLFLFFFLRKRKTEDSSC